MTSAQHHGRATPALFASRANLTRAIFGVLAAATDGAAILLLAIVTGILYHRIVYHDIGMISDFVQIGLLTACLYLIPSIYLSEYSVSKYLEFRKHPRRVSHF